MQTLHDPLDQLQPRILLALSAYLEHQLTFVQFPAYSEVRLWNKRMKDNINDDDYKKACDVEEDECI
jgi:hypothetical protein